MSPRASVPDLPRDHALTDGTVVRLREVAADDADRLLAMWDRTSAESRRARFMGPFTLDRTNVGRFVHLDPARQFAVVATRGRGDAERMLGIARFERLPGHPDRAEFAALVEDCHQGRGLGTALTDLLHRVGAMVEDLPEVAELDLNPVFVRPEGRGAVAVDVRLRLSRPTRGMRR